MWLAGRMSVGGWRRECWVGSRRAGLSLPIPHPLSLPPETPSYGHTSPLAVLHVCPAFLQAFPHSVPSTCSILFPILTRPACIGHQAQLRCPSSLLPSSPAAGRASPVLFRLPCPPHCPPDITWLHLGSPPPWPCSDLAAVDGSRGSQELAQSRCGHCSLAERGAEGPCGFLASGRGG